jgi:hypothetical protein
MLRGKKENILLLGLAPAMAWAGMFLVAFLAVARTGSAQTCGEVDTPDACEFAATTNGKMYSFNLATPISGYPQGALNENGFYKVVDGERAFWFQLCEHMKFNYDAPYCENCEDCGGPGHCGESCSALMSSSYSGASEQFRVCTTLGYPGSVHYSLIDQKQPELGVRVNMTTCKESKSICSFSVLVKCSRSGVEPPTTVTNSSSNGCDYEAILKHPAGCPVVTNVRKGGWGWFGSLFFLFLLVFSLYMAVGIAYRVTALGVSGLEAIPNLDTWRALPSKIQMFVNLIISKCMNIYYRYTANSYMNI